MIKNLILKTLIWLLMFNNKWLAKVLLKHAQRTPYVHLGDYMERWWLIAPPARPGEPGYPKTLFGRHVNKFRNLFPFYMRFHYIQRADFDRHLHDHPFWFISIILEGWYEEQYMPRETAEHVMGLKTWHPGYPDLIIARNTFKRVLKEGQINQKLLGDFHKISNIYEKGVLTLVIHGRKTGKSWGFLVNNERIHHNQYFGNKY